MNKLIEAAREFQRLIGEKAWSKDVWAGHCPYCNEHWMSGHSDTCRFDIADKKLSLAIKEASNDNKT